MGAVYAAENLNTGRRVAVKVLHGQWTQRPEVVQRFVREARATTDHRAPQHRRGARPRRRSHAASPYIVQEFLEGETLEAVPELAARSAARGAEALAIWCR
jgi:serine/threonine protein kinase